MIKSVYIFVNNNGLGARALVSYESGFEYEHISTKENPRVLPNDVLEFMNENDDVAWNMESLGDNTIMIRFMQKQDLSDLMISLERMKRIASTEE